MIKKLELKKFLYFVKTLSNVLVILNYELKFKKLFVNL